MQTTTLQILQITLQALSSFSIAAGLIFTGVQFRQARKAQLVSNFSKLVELQLQLRRIRVEDPSLADPEDVVGMNSPREVQEYFLNLMQLSLFEIAWYSYEQGQLQRDYYNSWISRMWQVSQEQGFRRMFESPSMKIMHDEFYDFMGSLIRSKTPPLEVTREMSIPAPLRR